MNPTDQLVDKPMVESTVENVEGTKVDEKYLSSIKELQQKVAEVRIGLGGIEMDFINLESQKESLKEILKSLIEQETKIAQEIENEYGVGSLDLETGLFIKQ
jgi:hypothetical protein